MALSDVMKEVTSERKGLKGEKKHYIPFDAAEFERLRVFFGKSDLMPNDIKLVLMGLCDGKLAIDVVKK